MNYRLFGKSGLRVSEICLGTMTFGLEWGWGADKDESRNIFDAYAEAGGNFVDTANRYTEGTSERWLGEFVKSERHHFVVATKYTLRDQTGDPNYAGNHRKNLMRSVEESLRRLDTDFIDLLWVHAWDGMTPVDEVLRGLDDLVRSGKVHYIGISDTPAWVVSQANTMAELRGWTAFVGLQIEYSLLQRAPERELLPMAKQFGLAITPWGAIGGGALTGKYLKGDTGRVVESSARRSARANGIAAEVVKHAEILGVTPAQLVINWTRQRDPYLTSIPIIGARTAAQLQDSLGCLNFQIPTETIQALDAASPIELGFPHEFLATDNIRELIFGGQYAKIIR
jgi:aryl-alcohol dehydrogenase-like predicted oxidoreductase